MNWNLPLRRTTTLEQSPSRPDGNRLRALIDQATTGCLDESDEHAGLLSTIREEVVCPFPARVGGADVECVRFEWPKKGYGLNAVCQSQGTTQVVDISRLECVDPLPKGHQWIDAYFAWRELLA